MRLPIAFVCLPFILVLGITNLGAQSDSFVDELMLEEQAGFGKGVYLTLLAGGLIADDASIGESLAVLEEQG